MNTPREIIIITRAYLGTDKHRLVDEFTTFWGFRLSQKYINLTSRNGDHHNVFFNEKSENKDLFKVLIINGGHFYKKAFNDPSVNDKDKWSVFFNTMYESIINEGFLSNSGKNSLLIYHFDEYQETIESYLKKEHNFKGTCSKFTSLYEKYYPYYEDLALATNSLIKRKENIKSERIVELLELTWSIHVERKKKETVTKSQLEQKLELLHHCLTPSGAKKVKELDYINNLKDVEIDGVGLLEFVEEHLASKEDYQCLEPEYVEPLKKLRDTLLN